MAGTTADKSDTGTKARTLSAEMETLADRIERLRQYYIDNLYGSSSAEEIIDSDLTDVGITAVQLASFITFAENLDKLLNNQVPTQADYSVTLRTLSQPGVI